MIVLSLGSNIGNRIENLKKAVEILESEGIEIIKTSSYYQTEPVGYKDQDDFINQVILVNAELSPDDLMKLLLETEKKLGRVREFKNGPRTVDIDIIDYNGQVIDTELVKSPHPRYQDRKFVLVPLKEVYSDFKDPITSESIDKLIDKTIDNSKIEKYNEI